MAYVFNKDLYKTVKNWHQKGSFEIKDVQENKPLIVSIDLFLWVFLFFQSGGFFCTWVNLLNFVNYDENILNDIGSVLLDDHKRSSSLEHAY